MNKSESGKAESEAAMELTEGVGWWEYNVFLGHLHEIQERMHDQ